MLTLLLALLFLGQRVAIAAPFQNLTDIQLTSNWESGPSGRGTTDILYNSACTLVLCVWNSVHLNIPAVREDKWITYRRKIKWVIIALLAPELLVFTAFQQWLAARKFLRELKCIQDKQAPESSVYLSQMQELDMTYAFYAIMGGFGVDISDFHNALEHATLTTHGLLLLARKAFSQYLDHEFIPDKSKVDLLAKFLVLFQIIEVIGNFIERKTKELPVSLLEYHTIIHVVCAIAMYLLWLRKPYNVQSPTILNHGEWLNELGYIVSSSDWAGCSGFEEERSKRRKWLLSCSRTRDPPLVWFGNLFQPLKVLSDAPIPGTHPLDRGCPHVRARYVRGTFPPRESWVVGQHGILEPPLDVPYYPANKVENTFVPAKGLEALFFLEPGQSLTTGFGPTAAVPFADVNQTPYPRYRVGISHNDLRRLEAAGVFFREVAQLREDSPLKRSLINNKEVGSSDHSPNPFSDHSIRHTGPRLICHRARNWAGLDELFDCLDSSSGWFWATFVAAVSIPGIYGGVHLIPSLSVPSLFSTMAEMILWRASCLLLVGFTCVCLFCGVMYGLLFGPRSLEALYLKYQMRQELEMFRRSDVWSRIWKNLWLGGVSTFICLSLAARAFLVIESFVSLRRVPEGVYQTPKINFISWVPHLS